VPLTDPSKDGRAHDIAVIVLTFLLTAHLLRQTRSGMLEFVQRLHPDRPPQGTARAIVLWRHGLRNGLTTTIAVLALDIG